MGNNLLSKCSNTAISLFALSALLLYSQNCSLSGPVSFDATQSQQAPLLSSRGGADGYDGKPSSGDYVRTFPDYNCAQYQDSAIQAKAAVNDTHVLLQSDNCESSSFVSEFTNPDLQFAGFNPDYFSIGRAIFERLKNATDSPQNITEAFCQFTDGSKGIDVVIKQSKDGSAELAKIYLGQKDNSAPLRWFTEVVNDFPVNKTSGPSETIFSSNSNQFRLNISNDSSGNIFKGQIATNIDGRNYQQSLSCRRLSEEPVLKINMSGIFAYYKADTIKLIKIDDYLQDSSGKGVDAKSTQYGPVNLTPGVVGQALPLNTLTPTNGAYDFFMNGAPVSSEQSSISLWYYQTSFDPNGANRIIDWWGTTPAGAIQSLGISLETTALGLAAFTSGNVLESGILPNNNSWNHLVVTFNVDFTRIYLNGTLVRSGTLNNLPADLTGGHLYFSIGNLNGDFSDPNRNNNAFVDEISFWTRELTASEILGIYRNISVY